MSDLGDKKYLDVLNDDTVYCLYTDAIDTICKMQKEASTENLKIFDIKEQRSELDIFRKWFLNEHLKINDETVKKGDFFKVIADEKIEYQTLKESKVFVIKSPVSTNYLTYSSRS